MGAWIYWAVVIVAAVLAYAMQPRPPKQKRPSLEDFSIPRANQGEPVPQVFGTVRITGPTVVWYGDLLVETETEDGVRTRKFYIGLHFTPCYGPVDSLSAIYAGGRLAWSGDVTVSDTITISAGDLFGGKRLSGGIAGDVDVMMGEPTQTANAYLTSVQGTPQPSYRGLLSLVANQIYISANATSIEPWAFDIRRIREGWYQDSCWYPETVEIMGSCDDESGSLYDAIAGRAPVVFLRFEEAPEYYEVVSGTYMLRDQVCINDGSGPDGYYGNPNNPGELFPVRTANTIVSDGRQSIKLFNRDQGGSSDDPVDPLSDQGLIRFANHSDYNYYNLRQFSIMCVFVAGDHFQEQTAHYFWHQGDTTIAYNQGLACGIETDIDPDTDYLFVKYVDYADHLPSGAWITLIEPIGYKIQDGERYAFFISFNIDSVDGHAFGRVSFWDICYSQALGAQEFPYAVPPTPANYEMYVGSVRAHYSNQPAVPLPSYSLRGTLDEFAIFPFEIEVFDEIGDLPDLICPPESGGYMNPAHIIYQALTDPDWGMGYPTSLIDDDSFRAAADTFYNEGLGLCLQWLQQEKIEEFIQHICDHAACILRTNPRTGKFNLKPLRFDYLPSSLTVYDESDIVEIESWERVGYGELVGEVTLTYRSVETNEDAAINKQNLAVIQAQSGVVSESINLPGIPDECIANRVCMRELKARSVPLARAKIKFNRSAWELSPGDVFKLSWAKLGLVEVIMRVVSVDTGTVTDNTVTVEATEDVYGMPDSTYAATQASGWTEPVAVDPVDSDGSIIYWEDGTVLRQESNNVTISE